MFFVSPPSRPFSASLSRGAVISALPFAMSAEVPCNCSDASFSSSESEHNHWNPLLGVLRTEPNVSSGTLTFGEPSIAMSFLLSPFLFLRLQGQRSEVCCSTFFLLHVDVRRKTRCDFRVGPASRWRSSTPGLSSPVQVSPQRGSMHSFVEGQEDLVCRPSMPRVAVFSVHFHRVRSRLLCVIN